MFMGAMMIYGTIGIFREFIPISSGLLAFARGLIGGIFLLFWVLLRWYAEAEYQPETLHTFVHQRCSYGRKLDAAF